MNTDRVIEHMARAIKIKRKEFGIDQTTLANAVGLNRTSICNIECGRQRPTPEVLYEICNCLNLNPNDLFPPPQWREYTFETITKNRVTTTVEQIQVTKAVLKQTS